MSDIHIGRRGLLRATGGAAVIAASGGLAACGDGAGTGEAQSLSETGVELPSYIPTELAAPDLAATEDGVLAGYYRFPRDLVNAFEAPPADGAGTVSILTNMFNPVPPGMGDNAYWQAVNDSVGAELDITMTPAADYLAKLSTVIASGDLPDMMLIASTLANRSEVLSNLCADLSGHLSGDKVADYPFLANFPTDSWLPSVYNGGIYGIPNPRAIVGTVMFARSDLFAAKSLNLAPGSFDELVEIATELTDPGANRWAFGNPRGLITYVANMLGVPNVWREEGGKFTSEFETEERREAVARVAELVEAGLFHPDAASENINLRDLLGNGTIAIGPDGYAAWDLIADTYGIEIAGVPAPSYDGGGEGVQRAGSASFGMIAFKQADDDRIAQLLSVANWLAAPIGSNEYMLRKFGVEGRHFNWEGDTPVKTELGSNETTVPFEYVTDATPILGPREQARVDAQRAYQETVISRVVRDPSIGFYSDTAINKAGELSDIVKAAELDIVSGRKGIEAWDEAVSAWRAAGGDDIRAEYEAAVAETEASPSESAGN
ncbi:extracellular solute-binding protein [Glycomyces harbinensis]|uniref:Putative aldouronate transport system substrate-binding protein n=1 Tax=Glycomyces harbinensis TaxID=58114 RepID=A0A1G6WX48_9ACTN|nr:extracellular solute-binding protein [Glycomyces harbinensis]SDD70468.1 putative aldouronate transport system substrate-binding protein [Glycomyces harbinensis]